MSRRPEIGNIQLYPCRPLRRSERNGYVLKFYCPIRCQRIRKNCGTRDQREARRILRECRERLLNGQYVASNGAITSDSEVKSPTMRMALGSSSIPVSGLFDNVLGLSNFPGLGHSIFFAMHQHLAPCIVRRAVEGAFHIRPVGLARRVQSTSLPDSHDGSTGLPFHRGGDVS